MKPKPISEVMQHKTKIRGREQRPNASGIKNQQQTSKKIPNS
jgi:hypothetical protein